MVTVSTSIQIQRPRQVVASYSADPSHAPEWYTNIKSVRLISPPPLGRGSKMAFMAEFLGRKLAYTYEVVEYDVNEKMIMRTSDGPFPMETTYRWESVDPETTRMTLINRGEPSGFSRWMAPFMQFMMRSENKKDLRRLKEILEKIA